MSEEFDSRSDSHSIKLEQRPQVVLQISFREFCGSKLSGLTFQDFKFHC